MKYIQHTSLLFLLYKPSFWLFFLFVLMTVLSPKAFAALPPGFDKAVVVNGLDNPTTFRFAPNGDMYIGEQGGVIRLFSNGMLKPTPVITLSAASNYEQGLLGMDLDPNFATNGYIYVSYTHSDGYTRLSRFTVTNGVADPASEFIFYKSDTQISNYHNADDVHWGPDGKLWWSVGDNLNNAYPQSLDSISGKILRFDPDGSSANDNPFHGQVHPHDYIYSYGFRNPFRFTFLPNNKAIVGDVGSAYWEEFNIAASGGNFGWPLYEGDCGNCGYLNPLYQYAHPPAPNNQAAVSAMTMYQGSTFPAAYKNVLFYGDYAEQVIHYLTFDSDFTSVESDTPFDDAAGTVVDMHVGPDGDLYYASIFSNTIYKIFPSGNLDPIATATADPIAGLAPLQVQFSSAGSYDPEGVQLTYTWDFGDGSSSTEANPTHTYTTNNKYVVKLTVSDGVNTSTANTNVTVGNRLPTATIDTPIEGTKYNAGDTISYSGSASDPEDGILPDSAYSWTIVLHHLNHTHPFLGPIVGKSGTFQIPTDINNESTTHYQLILTVTDSGGLQYSTTRDIYPNLVTLTIQTNYPGISFTMDGNLWTSSYTNQEVVGVVHTLNVLNPQTDTNGVTYRFQNWSDGGAQSHSFSVPSTDTNLQLNMYQTQPLPSPWLTADVGSPGIKGSADYVQSNNSFFVDGAGKDIWDTNDQFRYVYQSLTGDGSIIARVISQTNTSDSAKAGVMIKESTTAFAPYAMIGITPTRGYKFQWNFLKQSASSPGNTPNAWVKLTRSGNTFTAYKSSDGTNWTKVGSPQTVTMNANATIGLFVTSHNAAALSTANFDNVTITSSTAANHAPVASDQSVTTPRNTSLPISLSATDADNDSLSYSVISNPANGTLSGTAPNLTYTPNTGYTGNDSFTFKASDGKTDSNTATVSISITLPAGALPAPWQEGDIGTVTPSPGSASYDGASQTFSVIGGGFDIWDTHDDFHYVYQLLNGDGILTARVTSQSNTSDSAKAGVMIKQSLTPFDPYTLIGITPTRGYKFQWDFLKHSATGIANPLPNAWVRIKRAGNTFTSYTSADGITWNQVGSPQTVTMNTNATIGLFVTSHNSGVLSTATFDNVSITKP